MALQTWLVDELVAHGLQVVEVNGWRTRGSRNSDGTYKRFDPIGVQWHATAGSRTSTAASEVSVLLNGSTSAPPPIAQLMIYRDGVIYVVAAGRCNHNLVGWAGPNKGLGNGDLLGIEMANDNRGEPWPQAQLVAARLATAVIMRKLGADPLRRLSGHYEHQPYPPPPGETSTKTDPAGVRMIDERPRVAALIQDLEDPVTPEDITAIAKASAEETARKLFGDLSDTSSGLFKATIARVRDGVGTFWWDAYHSAKEDDAYKAADAAGQRRMRNAEDTVRAVVGGPVDPADVIAGVLAGIGPAVDPQQLAAAVAAALPALPTGQPDLVRQFADELAARLAA